MTSARPHSAPKGTVYHSALEVLEGIADGASVLVAGYAGRGVPEMLLHGLAETGAADLTLVCQGTWLPVRGPFGFADLVATGQVKQMVSPMRFHPDAGGPVKDLWESGKLELVIVPPGLLAAP